MYEGRETVCLLTAVTLNLTAAICRYVLFRYVYLSLNGGLPLRNTVVIGLTETEVATVTRATPTFCLVK